MLWAVIGVMSEGLSQTTAVFSEFPVGIIQAAITRPRDKIGAERFTELKAIPLPQKLGFDPATEVHHVFLMSVHSSYICKAVTLPSTLNPSL